MQTGTIAARVLRLSLSSAVLLGCLAAGPAKADLLFDRGLPTANLNTGNASQSNVIWAFAPHPPFFSGDDFTLGSVPAGAANWVIDDIRIWTAAGAIGNTGYTLGSEYSSITLYGGPDSVGVSPLISGNISGNTATNNITFTPVQYAGNLDYQGSSGNMYQLWQVDFGNLNWLVSANTLTDFGVDAVTTNPADYWFNHASNAALSGSTQQGADNLLLWFDSTNLANYGTWDSGPGGNGGFSSSTDINVQVFGHAVPEPGTLLLLGLGLSGLALRRRKGAV